MACSLRPNEIYLCYGYSADYFVSGRNRRSRIIIPKGDVSAVRACPTPLSLTSHPVMIFEVL